MNLMNIATVDLNLLKVFEALPAPTEILDHLPIF